MKKINDYFSIKKNNIPNILFYQIILLFHNLMNLFQNLLISKNCYLIYFFLFINDLSTISLGLNF